MNKSFRITKMADIEALLPGFTATWKQMKPMCGTTQRCPKRVVFTDTPSPATPNDSDCAKRFSLNLETMKIEGAVHISAGEWACHAGDNHDREVVAIPSSHALLTCTYNDYYRSFTMTVQVSKLPATLPEATSPW